MGFWLKRKFRFVSPCFELHIVSIILTLWYIIAAEIWDGKNQVLQLFLDFTKRFIQTFYSIRSFTHLRNKSVGLLFFFITAFFQPGNFFGSHIAFVLEVLHLCKQFQAFLVNGGKFVHFVCGDASMCSFVTDKIQIFSNKAKFKHDGIVLRL